MPWNLTVSVKDFWHDNAKTIIEKRDLAVARIKASGWREISSDPDEFDVLVANLAVTPSVSEFDYALSWLYDLADADRVWIETF